MAKRDLRSFKNGKGRGLTRDEVKSAARKANVNIGDVKEDELHGMEETISQYENKSEGELMSDLEKMIHDGRKNGTFSDDMLDAFIKNVSPMMDGAQKKKMENIARKIKNKEI
jgi:hypothetical protein